jgi:uncharacterized repeat protein (TIGR02543 family)
MIVNRPDDPTKNGYTFTGWFNAGADVNSELRELVTWPYRLIGSVTMFAGWKSGENVQSACTLTFNSGGGSQVPSVPVHDSGTKVSKPVDPTREGYTFTGWFSAATGGILQTWPYPVTGNVTMYAQWRSNSETPPEQSTITFDSHGGSAVTTITADSGTEVEKPADPGKAGYTFTGWYGAASGGSAHTWPYTLSADVTMHAQWTVSTYSISYELNGGTGAGGNPATYTIEDLPITLSNPTREHYTFAGWYADTEFTGTKVTQIDTGNIGIETLYAKWTGIDYTITFNSHGGSEVTAIKAAGGTAVQKPADPTRTGYTFTGWFSAATGGTLYSWLYTITGDITMHAQWWDNAQSQPTQYTITFNSEGGSNVTAVTAAGRTQVAKPADPAKEGYTFTGWYSAATGGTAHTWPHTLSADVTMHAQWTANTYTVSYNGNGGTGTTTGSSHTYGLEGALATNGFTRTGYTFMGWNTQANGGGTSYADGVSVKNLSAENGATVTLYAKWTANTYTVTYDGNGSSGGTVPGNTSHTYGTASALAANSGNLAKTGYTFAGWNRQADGSDDSYTAGQNVTNLTSTADATVTLYAKWTGITYTVTYDGNGSSGGTVPGDTSHSYGTASALATNSGKLVKTGFIFAGWNTAADGSGTSYNYGETVTNLTSTEGGTVTLYAQWKNDVSITVTIGGSGDILVSGDDVTISRSGAGSVPKSFNVVVTDGYTVVRWYSNGDEIGGSQGTAQSITIRAVDYPAGSHSLTVRVTKNSKPDSADISFTVID